MSKYLISALFSLLLILQTFNNCIGQTSEVNISIHTEPPAAEIKGRTDRNSSHNFSLVRDYAGISNLADRISDLGLEDEKGEPVAYKKFVPGEYVASSNFSSWRYKMDLSPNKIGSAAAHTSWIGKEAGLLFFEDLLPILVINKGSSVRFNVNITVGWQIFGSGSGTVLDPSNSVLFLANHPRVS